MQAPRAHMHASNIKLQEYYKAINRFIYIWNLYENYSFVAAKYSLYLYIYVNIYAYNITYLRFQQI